jgi:hypothetical protein
MQGIFDAGDLEEDDHDDSDSDSDSDSGSESDDEVDPGHDAKPFDRLAVLVSAEKLQEPGYEGRNDVSSSFKASLSLSSVANTPGVHARRGKLPKVSKIHRLARVVDSTSTPPTPPITLASQNSPQPNDMVPQLTDLAGASGVDHYQHGDGETRPHVKSFAEILADDTFVNDGFPPEPIEGDTMELLWKHVTPLMSIEDRHPRIGVRLGRANRVPPALAPTSEVNASAHGPEEGRSGDERSMYVQPATADDVGRSSATTRRKRRADSLAPRSKRLSLGLCGQSSSGFSSASSSESSTSPEEHLAHSTPPRTFMSIRSLDRMEPKSTHNHCVVGRPCNDHESGRRPVPRNPRAKVYHNSFGSTSPVTVDQAEYILSQCNCYWAWTFTRIWNAWCAGTLSADAQKLSQVEVLLLFPDRLRDAARDCCPRGRGQVVEID